MIPRTGIVVILTGAFLGVAGEGRSPASTEPWDRVLEELSSREFRARIHVSLQARYQLPAGETWDRHGDQLYSREDHPVRVGSQEEWPAGLSGSMVLLQDPRYARILRACRDVREEPATGHTPIERILFQGDLWAVFDLLYLEGIRLDPVPSFDAARWRTMLEELALTMWHVACTAEEVEALPEGGRIRARILKDADPARITEFYTLQHFSVHDAAHQFRRVNRFFYYDPRPEAPVFPSDGADRLGKRNLALPEGTVALVEEDALTITRDQGLVATPVAALFKSYEARPSPLGKEATFWMYRLDRKAVRLDPSALVTLPPETESWARVDLPALPGHRGKPAFRAPMAVACAGCHGKYPNAFSSHGIEVDLGAFRFTQSPQTFSGERVSEIKGQSAEYAALKRLFDRQRRLAEAAAAPLPEGAAEPRSGFRVLTIVSLAGFLGSLGILIFIRWAHRSEPHR